MNNEIDSAILRLNQHRNLTLREASGGCIYVHWGRVWVTRNGDLGDHVISNGESLAIDRAGTTILTAISDAGVSLMKRCAQSPGAASVVMQQTGSADTGEVAAAANNDPAGEAVRLNTIESDVPAYGEIDRRVDRAHQLRARYVSDVLGNAWSVLRRALNG